MEIDITRFAETAQPFEFSASRGELGDGAAHITWENAKREAADAPLLPADRLEEFRDWIAGFGAWDTEEINSWDATTCNALLIQYISGDLRELERLCGDSEGSIDWAAARKLSEAGIDRGTIFLSDDGRVYFIMSH